MYRIRMTPVSSLQAASDANAGAGGDTVALVVPVPEGGVVREVNFTLHAVGTLEENVKSPPLTLMVSRRPN